MASQLEKYGVRMVLSSSERKSGRLSGKKLSEALGELSEVGYVVIERAITKDLIEEIRINCDRALAKHMKIKTNQKRAQENGGGHVGMFSPTTLPFMDQRIIENKFTVQILKNAMDQDFFCTFYNTNTAWPGCGRQHVHRDTSHLFSDLPFSLPMHMAVVNIPLVDFTIENGATEVWPGSHLITDISKDSKTLEAIAEGRPSLQTVMPAGSLVVRDMRMWHRGMPNNTISIRTMLALVYFRGFLNRDSEMTIPRSTWDQMSENSKHLFRFNKIGRQ